MGNVLFFLGRIVWSKHNGKIDVKYNGRSQEGNKNLKPKGKELNKNKNESPSNTKLVQKILLIIKTIRFVNFGG